MSEYITEWVSHNIEDPFVREEIVRCRDCEYYATDELGDCCTLMDFEDVKGMADMFCAWGEKAVKDESDKD